MPQLTLQSLQRPRYLSFRTGALGFQSSSLPGLRSLRRWNASMGHLSRSFGRASSELPRKSKPVCKRMMFLRYRLHIAYLGRQGNTWNSSVVIFGTSQAIKRQHWIKWLWRAIWSRSRPFHLNLPHSWKQHSFNSRA